MPNKYEINSMMSKEWGMAFQVGKILLYNSENIDL